MPRLRLRTVAAQATSLTHGWPLWAPLAVFALGCALATIALQALQLTLGLDDSLLMLHRFGPAIAVGLLFVVFTGHHHRPYLAVGRSLTWRTPIAALGAVVLGVIIVVVAMAVHEIVTGIRVPLVATAPMVLLVAVQIVGALGEETAWRAYLQPELEQWVRPLPAAVAVGVVWALWHTLVLHPPLGFGLAYAVTVVGLSVALRGALRFTRGNYLVVATLFRATIGLGVVVALPQMASDPLTYWALAGASVAVALATWAVVTWRPSATPRTEDRVTGPRAGARQHDWVQDWGLPLAPAADEPVQDADPSAAQPGFRSG